MTYLSRSAPLPHILIGWDDFETLNRLADAAGDTHELAAQYLRRELDRAAVVATAKLNPEVVRLGSFVTYIAGKAPPRTVQLVLPGQADIAAGRISILTPVGAALIGLRAGQAITFTAPQGRTELLQTLKVEQERGN
jgi:regulator of nucleoside diphosphate kinase